MGVIEPSLVDLAQQYNQKVRRLYTLKTPELVCSWASAALRQQWNLAKESTAP